MIETAPPCFTAHTPCRSSASTQSSECTIHTTTTTTSTTHTHTETKTHRHTHTHTYTHAYNIHVHMYVHTHTHKIYHTKNLSHEKSFPLTTYMYITYHTEHIYIRGETNRETNQRREKEKKGEKWTTGDLLFYTLASRQTILFTFFFRVDSIVNMWA